MPTYEAIENIRIGAYDPGMWRDAVIFSADFDIGFTDKPTKFIINCVNVGGIYNTNDRDLSYLVPYNISFGPFKFRFYLESYQIQKAVGKTVLQLTFVDGSTLLDRVYVALGNKHNMVHANAWAAQKVYFPVLCEAPEFFPPGWAVNGLVNLSKIANVKVRNTTLDWDAQLNTVPFGGRIEEGGMITVGWETPTMENWAHECVVQDWKYNFSHLMWHMQQFGIKVKGDFLRTNPLTGAVEYNDRNPFNYKSFGGQTLREVLNQWCSLQGFSYYYDWLDQAVVGIDEYGSTAWRRYDQVEALINNELSQDFGILPGGSGNSDRIGALIEQSTKSATLEGTKKRYVSSKAVKSASPDQPTNYDYYAPIKFYPLDLPHLVPNNQRGGITGFNNLFRSDTQFRMSVGLSKFNRNAREIFNVAIGCHEATGIQILGEIDLWAHPGISGNPMAPQAVKWLNKVLLDATGQASQLITTMNKWTFYWNIPFKVYFVKYNATLETEFNNWEKKLADVLGKHYLNFDQMQNWERCDGRGFGHFRRVDSTIPRSEKYYRMDVIAGKKPYPFADVLKDAYGLVINTNLFGPLPPNPLALNSFNMLTRSSPGPAWDTSQAEFDKVVSPVQIKDADDMLAQWQPFFIPATGPVQAWILQCLPHLNWVGGGNLGNVTVWGNNMITTNDANSRQAIMNALMAQARDKPKDVQVGIYIHPDYSHPNFPFKIKNVSYVQYENLEEKAMDNNTNNLDFRQDCPIGCGGISPRQMLCDGLKHQFQSREWPTGLEPWNLGTFANPYWTLPAFGFQIEYNYPPDRAGQPFALIQEDVVFPTWSAYIANHKTNIFRRILDPKIEMIINGFRFDGSAPGNVASIEVTENDFSSMIDQDPTRSDIKILLPMASVDPNHLAGNFHAFGNPMFDAIKLTDLHRAHVWANEVPTVNSIYGRPRKNISCTVAGMQFGSLTPFLDPSYGLNACSIRMGAEGVTSELRYSNKPPVSLDNSMLFRSIQTDIIRGGGIFPMM